MSFLILLLYIIATFLRPQDWVPGFYGLRLINTLALAVAFFLFIERFSTKKPAFAKVPQNKLMIGLFCCILLSHLTHTYVYGMIFSFKAFAINYILFFLVLNSINTRRKFTIAIWLIIGLIVILVPQGMYQLEHGYGWAGQRLTFDPHRQEVRINWVGIFNDPNDLALTFVIALGIIIAFIFARAGFVQRMIAIPSVGLLIYGIYLTNSRGGVLALMATIFFYFVKRTKKFVFGGIVGGSAAAAIFAFGPSRLGLLTTSEASAHSRIDLWYEGILMIKSNPLFGVGYDMFMDSLPQTAHNSYILAASELGLVGLFFFMALIYSSFKGLSLVQTHDASLRPYAYGLQAALIGFCTAAFFLSRTYIILPYILFALAGSLMYVAKERNQELDFTFTKKDVKTTALLSLGVLLLAYIVIKIGT